MEMIRHPWNGNWCISMERRVNVEAENTVKNKEYLDSILCISCLI